MPSVANIACDVLNEVDYQPPRITIDMWHPPGYDGIGLQDLGKGDSSFAYRAVLFDSEDNVETWMGMIGALQGSVVTIIDDWGRQRKKMVILQSQRGQNGGKRADPINGGCRGEMLLQGVVLQ